MPTYTYRCANSHNVEAVQSFTDDPLTACPTCGAQLRKTYNSVGVVFKGSGFYRNDSRSESKSSESSSSDSSKSSAGNGAAKPAEGGGAKTESAPAAKASSPSGSTTGATASSGSAA